MLKAATEDFQASGFTVRSFLDSRLEPMQSHLNADELVYTSPSYTVQRTLAEMLESSDLSLIIAPETDGILSGLVRVASSNTTSLNSTPDSIDAVADKARLATTLHRSGLPTPEARCLSIGEGVEEAERVYREFSGWVVVKPVDGVGCEDLSIVKSREQLRQAFESLAQEGRAERFIIQKYIEGLPVSVSLLSDDEVAYPVSLNLQRIALNPPSEPSSYLGGVVPLLHPDVEEAFSMAKKAVEVFRGLKGYLGVDMVLSSNGPLILEINPRLTVSYVGLKRVSKVSIAEYMVKSARREGLPASFELEGVSAFSKIHSEAIEGVRDDVNVLCPRVRVDGEDLSQTIFVANGRTEDEAEKKLEDAVALCRMTGGRG